MRTHRFLLPIIALFAIGILVACTSPEPTAVPAGPTPDIEATVEARVQAAMGGAEAEGGRLERVRARGTLVCAGNDTVAGFGFLDADGSIKGFDVDLCRAVAAAVLSDPDAIELRPTTAAERGPVMQSGEIDMMSRNTTWTTSRDVQWGNFAQTMFYDGQGFMTPVSMGVSSIPELQDATICVQQGTTTELNLQDFSNQNGMNFSIITFPDNISTDEAYTSGQCDALTTDRSGLVSARQGLPNPDEHTILPGTISEEPLGPVVPSGDDQWYDIVKMVMAILIYAEAFGVTSDNVPTTATGNTPGGPDAGAGRCLRSGRGRFEFDGGAGRHQGRGQLRRNLRAAPGSSGHSPGGQPQRPLERGPPAPTAPRAARFTLPHLR